MEAAAKASERRIAGLERQLAAAPGILAEVRTLQAGVGPVLRRAEAVLHRIESTSRASATQPYAAPPGGRGALGASLSRLRRLAKRGADCREHMPFSVDSAHGTTRGDKVIRRIDEQAARTRELLSVLRHSIGKDAIPASCRASAAVPAIDGA
jgi:hypothetical protein